MLESFSIANLAVVIISILVSLTIHEAMHAYVAHALGDTTAKDEGRLTLNPLQHVDLLMTIGLPVVMIILGLPPLLIAKPVPFDPRSVRYGEYGAALVALAGPFTNLGLAAVGAFVMRLVGFDSGLAAILNVFVQINITFFVFNMIPFPPLDGSRLLYAFAPEPLQRVMHAIESAGFMVIILVFLLAAPIVLPIVSNVSEAIYSFLL